MWFPLPLVVYVMTIPQGKTGGMKHKKGGTAGTDHPVVLAVPAMGGAQAWPAS
jgi:hypothetical protein